MGLKRTQTQDPCPFAEVLKEAKGLMQSGLSPEDAIRSLSNKFIAAYKKAGGAKACRGKPDMWVFGRAALLFLRVPEVPEEGAQGFSMLDVLGVEGDTPSVESPVTTTEE